MEFVGGPSVQHNMGILAILDAIFAYRTRDHSGRFASPQRVTLLVALEHVLVAVHGHVFALADDVGHD